jgi:hypothetical protein
MPDSLHQFNAGLTAHEKSILDKLRKPVDIQAFLDELSYPSAYFNRSSLQVMREHTAHCLDGGLFASACLLRLGFPPLILDLQPNPGRDDDHVLALFKVDGCWGACAKSNYMGLRFREAVYRTLRELVMSYFEGFFNINREKTLRYYTRPINLNHFDRYGWVTSSSGVDMIEKYLKSARLISLITTSQASRLSQVDKRSYRAATLETNPAGVFRPK